MHASPSACAATSDRSRSRVGSAIALNGRPAFRRPPRPAGPPVTGEQQAAQSRSSIGDVVRAMLHRATRIDKRRYVVHSDRIDIHQYDCDGASEGAAIMGNDELREQVRSRYAAAATAVTGDGTQALTILDGASVLRSAGEPADASCCGCRRGGRRVRRPPSTTLESRANCPAEAVAGQPGLRQPGRRRRTARGRAGARPGLRRRHRRTAVRPAGRADRLRRTAST